MAAECRLCNRRAVTPSEFGAGWKPCYGKLCRPHLRKVLFKMQRRRALAGNSLECHVRSFDEDEFVIALTRLIEGYARLIDAGEPLEDCQAVSAAGDQCRYHGRQQVNGVWLCSQHARDGYGGPSAPHGVMKIAARLAAEIAN